MTVTIEKIHYEPYPIRDMVTAWECDSNEVDFLISLKEHTQELRKVFDNKSDWAYDVADADIFLDGLCDSYGSMPSWSEIDSFLNSLDEKIKAAAEDYITADCDIECEWVG